MPRFESNREPPVVHESPNAKRRFSHEPPVRSRLDSARPRKWVLLDHPPRSACIILTLSRLIGSCIQDPVSRILDPGSWIQDPVSGILEPGSWIQDPGSWIQDPGCRILDLGSWIQDPGSRIWDPGSWILDPGSWILDP